VGVGDRSDRFVIGTNCKSGDKSLFPTSIMIQLSSATHLGGVEAIAKSIQIGFARCARRKGKAQKSKSAKC
ncbi:MAG TPA: hypothetical protein VJH03_07780, partial [Blastocatellia bacterium]|nr:hypothetical protein [Blastocatellia bacterium]